MLESLMLFTGLTGGACILADAYSLYLKGKRSKIDYMANRRLGSADELLGLIGNDGLLISDKVQLKEKTDFEGSLILGPTGAGKTSSFFFTNLLSNFLKESIVVSDAKGNYISLQPGTKKKYAEER
jgi:type IV secretion system protein VirD4